MEDVEAAAPPGSLHTVFRVRDRLAQAEENEIPEFGLKNALSYQCPLISIILRSGYTFDGVSGDILQQRGLVRGARLQLGDGSYAAVMLPRLDGMRLGALEKLADFVRAGGSVIAIGKLPERVYGGIDPASDSNRLRSLVAQIFGSERTSNFARHAYGRGQAIVVKEDSDLPRALADSCPPDLALSNPDAEVGFVHRRATASAGNEADYYFIVNTSDRRKLLRASFRISHRQPQIWDLESGDATMPAIYSFEGDRTAVDLRLEPRRSAVVYFGSSHLDPPLTSSDLPLLSRTANEASAEVEAARTYSVQIGRERRSRTVSNLPEPIVLTTPWNLDFRPRLKVTRKITVLKSWTDDPATRYFSGMAMYTTTFSLPATYLGADKLVWLDLGDVRYAARAWVNGKLAGDTWQKPFRLEVSRWLRPGTNALKIEVANLLINALLGQRPPDYSRLIATYGDRFPYPEDWTVNPEPWQAGLLGPVRLVPGIRIEFPLSSIRGEGQAISP